MKNIIEKYIWLETNFWLTSQTTHKMAKLNVKTLFDIWCTRLALSFMWGYRRTADCLQSVSPTRASKTDRAVAKSLAVKICSKPKSHLSASCAEWGEWDWVCLNHRGKKANLGDFPVSHEAAEAKVMFTWVVHDKTREAKCQEQIGANLIFGVCVHYVYKRAQLGGKVRI